MKASEACKSISKEQVIEIKYEDLLDSEEHIRKLCEFIGLSDPEVVVEKYNLTKCVSNRDKWEGVLNADELIQLDAIFGDVLKEWGYIA